ncbi:MAG: hypothetical protein NUK54_10900 [Methanothrix sp.]|nr:hypothetical protein [Methanothrix sp.]
MIHATLDDWIRDEAIPFSLDSPETLNKAIDKLIASLDPSVELLGFGETLHGGEEILLLRNRIFQRLAEEHGYSAITIESSFSRSRAVNEYVVGRGPASYEAVMEGGIQPRLRQAGGEPRAGGVDEGVQLRSLPSDQNPVLRLRQPHRDDLHR